MARCSDMAETLIGSEIIKLAGVIRQKIASGEKIYNFTIGDFEPAIYPLPDGFRERIVKAYESGKTNYPPASGLASLRAAAAAFTKEQQGLDYPADAFLVSGGARPLIYAIYRTLLDPGDKVIYPVPSWNNNHYCHLSQAQGVEIHTLPEGNFMPTAAQIAPLVGDAVLLALCSPLNPTGTCFSEDALKDICQLVLEENRRRAPGEKPLYILYDQIYQVLTYGDVRHVDPVNLCPELRPYVIYVDGMSKAFAATGVRVGWAFGPEAIMNKMASILSHVGAWAPNPEQFAAGEFLADSHLYQAYLSAFKDRLSSVLAVLYEGFVALKAKGYAVDAIPPQAGLYLTVKLDLTGYRTAAGQVINAQPAVWDYVLNQAGMALVPFSSFGDKPDSPWYRLSIGTCTPDIAAEALASLEKALSGLSKPE
jgi:aspartate aminotransferase